HNEARTCAVHDSDAHLTRSATAAVTQVSVLFRLIGTFARGGSFMQNRTSTLFFPLPVLVAVFALTVSSALAQRKTVPADELQPRPGCPSPVVVTLTAGSPNVVNADFTPAQLALPRAVLNETAPNKAFLYTFQWKRDERCCEITKAVLTVKMKALQGGQSN